MNPLATNVLSWLLTYAVHSTALLLLAGVVARWPVSAAVRDVLWKTALLGGIITATVQVGLGIRPTGTFALPAPVPVVAGLGAVGSANVSTTAGEPEAARVADAKPGPATPLTAAPAVAAAGGEPSTGEAVGPSGPFNAAAGIVLAWIVIGLVLVVAYGARRMILIGRLGDRRLVVDGRLPRILSALAPRAGTARVTLTASTTISSPVALGLREICVPSAAITDLDEDQQRGLLAHELAHLARRDPVWLDAASLIERALFFQPLNRMARREMQMAAEYLCDDWAAAHMGSGVPLAKCLARVAEWIEASPLGVPVAGMAEQRSLLVERIARLVEQGAPRRAAPRAAMTGIAMLLLGGMIAAAPGVQSARPQRAPYSEAERGVVTRDPVSTVPDSRPPDSAAPAHLTSGSRQGSSVTPAPTPSASPSVSAEGREQQGAPAEEQDPAVVAALIERLKDTDVGVRRAAANSLGNLKSKRAVSALIAVLSDKDREVRSTAANALGEIRDPKAINPLLDLIRDPSAQVRQAALGALDNFEHEEILAGPIAMALSDANVDVRQRAAHLLGSIGDRATVGALVNALRDPSADVRSAAAQALGEIKASGAAMPLVAALRDPHPDVRHSALHALDDMKAHVPDASLLELFDDESADVRQSAVSYVKDRPFAGAVAALVKLVDDPKSDVRVEAVSALGEIRDPAASRAIRSALTSKDPKVRARAAEVLGERP